MKPVRVPHSCTLNIPAINFFLAMSPFKTEGLKKGSFFSFSTFSWSVLMKSVSTSFSFPTTKVSIKIYPDNKNHVFSFFQPRGKDFLLQ